MSDYKINIFVEGHDKASGPLRSVGSSLSSVGNIAGGILGAQIFTGFFNGLTSIASGAIDATASLQAMQVGMEGMIAREIAMQSATEGIAMSIGQALPMATERAAELMAQLEDIAITSPFQLETINNTFRQAMAFGATTEQAKLFTTAMLNVASGTGATNEMMGRMAYNMAQIRLQGQITAVDMRQLAMAGFDLGGVIKFAGEQFGLNISTHEEFNKALEAGQITMDQFFQAFDQYASTNFGGASERMSRTLNGLKSTFADVFVLTIPKIIGPAVEQFTAFAGKVLDSFLKIRKSGILEKWAVGVGDAMSKALAMVQPIFDAVSVFFDDLSRGANPLLAFKNMLLSIFGGAIFRQIMGVVSAFKTFVGWLQQLGAWIAPLVAKVSEFILANVQLKDVFIALGIIIAAIAIPALISIASALWPIFALIGVVALLRTAWEQNWGGIQEKLGAAWAWIQPILMNLWNWLAINVPIALTTLANFWSGTLLPAIMGVWNWVQTVAIPIIVDLWTWLSTNIPAAISAVSGFWTGTLLPALTSVWDYLSLNIFPIFTTIADIMNIGLSTAITALAGLWQNILLPALTLIWGYLSTNLLPIFESVKNFLENDLGPKVEWFTNTIIKPLGTSIAGGLTSALQTILQKLREFRDMLANIKLPSWLTPGSPTPFEMGLRGINKAMGDLNRTALPSFQANLGFGGMQPATATAGGPVNITMHNTISSDMDIEALAYRLTQVIRERRQ